MDTLDLTGMASSTKATMATLDDIASALAKNATLVPHTTKAIR